MELRKFLEDTNLGNHKYPLFKKVGASCDDLETFEKKHRIKLPSDIVELYTVSNGIEGDNFIFNIIPLSDIEKENDSDGEYLVFAEYLIYSETCGLNIDQTKENSYNIFTWSRNADTNQIVRKYLASSVVEFLQIYLDKGTFGIWSD